jgi:hypothetical protein
VLEQRDAGVRDVAAGAQPTLADPLELAVPLGVDHPAEARADGLELVEVGLPEAAGAVLPPLLPTGLGPQERGVVGEARD